MISIQLTLKRGITKRNWNPTSQTFKQR